MPVPKVRYRKRSGTKTQFENLHGVSLAEVAARAAFPPRVRDPKKELPKLTVVEDEVPDAELVDNTGDIEQGITFNL